MKVIRADSMGFCMGVRRAVDMAQAELQKSNLQRGRPVYTMGPLIHNPQVMEKFRRQGLGILESDVSPDTLPSDLRGACVIIRAHGIRPALERSLRDRGALIVDATCPKVKKSQIKARELSEKQYVIFLAGESQHGEIIGLQGYADRCIVVAGAEEADSEARKLQQNEGVLFEGTELKSAGVNGTLKTALIGQTTISAALYEKIGGVLRRYFPSIKVIDTICGAAPQESLRKLCAEVEAVVVAGGRSSANTRRLLDIALEAGKPAWLVETAADLDPEITAYSVVGLSAGASTPDDIIDEIEAALEKL
ncbi:4-hydroxy-3-methylbut-2-enyl diphosphate reductase [Spirochaetia bacterium]|nr:4-hydroxy-3-methylbut-2-enyl diphosphate reductase [Spirochaetia bacterium]